MDDLANDLAGLLGALGIEKAHIVGLSIGGMTAQALAVHHPQRVESLVLISTAAHMPPPEFWYQRAAKVREQGPEAVVDTIIPRWFTPQFQERDRAAVKRIRDRFLDCDRRGYARCCEALAEMDLRGRIGAIAAPTLVIAGANDAVAPPAMGEEIRSRIPGAEMVVLPDCAHLLAVEQPEATAWHIATFVDRQTGTPGDAFADGLANRRAVLGTDHVDHSFEQAGAFGKPWQEFITRTAWHEAWGDPTLPRKTRSILTLTTMIALHREEEFKLHLRPALKNGVTLEELGALIRHAAVYAGIPAGNAAMRWVRDVLGDELK
jgi:3-oxoadipate enol-lactonase/4-carboxymuconolactone decarboxylase